VRPLGGTLGDVGLDEVQSPVVGDVGGPGVGEQSARLGGCRVEREAAASTNSVHNG
jgi:hypothetical protein